MSFHAIVFYPHNLPIDHQATIGLTCEPGLSASTPAAQLEELKSRLMKYGELETFSRETDGGISMRLRLNGRGYGTIHTAAKALGAAFRSVTKRGVIEQGVPQDEMLAFLDQGWAT